MVVHRRHPQRPRRRHLRDLVFPRFAGDLDDHIEIADLRDEVRVVLLLLAVQRNAFVVELEIARRLMKGRVEDGIFDDGHNASVGPKRL